jgi:hypothetical protein
MIGYRQHQFGSEGQVKGKKIRKHSQVLHAWRFDASDKIQEQEQKAY